MKILHKNKIIIFFLVLFITISLISIYSASMYLSPTLGKLYYKQLFWYIIGIFIIILLNKINIRSIYKYSTFIYTTNILLLVGLLFFSNEINGSKSWYTIQGIGSFQPSEFMKISLILFNSNIIYNFYKKEKKISSKTELKLITTMLIITLIPSILTFLQPDTGAVIIYFIIFLSMLFSSGINKKWFIYIGSILLSIFIIFFYLYFFKENTFINIFGNNFFYRIDRLINWQNGSGMQLNNSLAAIGSSGLTGHGFNNTPIYFPEAGTDFIFAVYASNFGLIGSIILITILLLFDIYLIKIAKDIYSIQDKYTIIGITSVIFYQQIQNIGMTFGLFPITGITLPLISYGGSSLLSYLLLVGIIINILNLDKKKKAYK
ncbi:MAG: FtsW/RodA/SpoVE family cell cycle protein [Bacilli bacterium]|nr:FtsW/RodA/SpoVE family cell cycle protein [Bacilli bacterium]